MRDRFHLSNSAIFAVMWVALSGLVLHDISLRHSGSGNGTSVSDRVVTKEFMLVDDNGTTRARIGMSDKTNAPTVQLFDVAGAQRAQLRLNKDDVPSLRLYGADGKTKSVVGFTLNDMQPTFVTFDAYGVGHVENRTRPDAAYATVQDEDLSGGRYVQSYRGDSPVYYSGHYSGITPIPSNPDWNLLTAQQAQANAEAARLQVEANADSARLQAQVNAEVAQQQAELARQRAVNDAINAAADKVNAASSPFQRVR